MGARNSTSKALSSSSSRDERFIFIYNIDLSVLIELYPLIKYFVNRDPSIIIYTMLRVPSGFKELTKVLYGTKFLGILKRVRFIENVDPFEFLWFVRNAEFVVTNSFHGTVFSIIFEKPFVSMPLHGKSVRILDLLSLLNLKNRFARSASEALQKVPQSIDYLFARDLLESHRLRSLELLRSALEYS
jgi:Polysaccharide pyruvyl transferase.